MFLAGMMTSGGHYQQPSCYSSQYKLGSLIGTSQISKYRIFLSFVPIQILSGHMNLVLDKQIPSLQKRTSKRYNLIFSCKSGKKYKVVLTQLIGVLNSSLEHLVIFVEQN